MDKETVLITGSEGSLMQSLIPLLVDKYEVVGFDSLERYDTDKRPHPVGAERPSYAFEKIDLTNSHKVNDLMWVYQPDYVIQAAAKIYGVGGFNKYCADIISDDIALHRNILNSCVHTEFEDRNHRVKRVIYISSSMVYEGIRDRIPVVEEMVNGSTSSPVPLTDYGLSKLVCERMSIAYEKQYGLPYTIWRPFNIITPEEIGEDEIGISHVFADFIRMIVEDGMNPMPILGDGEQVRCFTWILDVVKAIANHSFSETTKNQIYNLGNPQPITMKELATMIYNEFHRKLQHNTVKPLEFVSKTPYLNDVTYRVPNVDKAMMKLDWSAQKRVEECIAEVVDAYIKRMKW